MGEFSWWHILIIVAVFMLLFGAKRLPDAARSLGQSLRIFKAETKGLREEDAGGSGAHAASAVATPQITAAPAAAPAPVAPAPAAPVEQPVAHPAEAGER